MKKMLILILILNFNFFPTNSKAVTLDGIDISPAIIYFSRFVKKLDRDVTVFHWDNSNLQGNDVKMLREVRAMARTYWARFGTYSGNLYGDGLYLAIDPIATNDFGNSNNWSLLELTLKKNLNVLDFKDSYIEITLNIPENESTALLIKLLEQFNCRITKDPHEIFYYQSHAVDTKCTSFLKTIFNDFLQIQVIRYNYSQSTNYPCAPPTGYAESAFIVTDPNWIKKGYFQFYNSESNDLETRNERLEIQSLFLYEKEQPLYQYSIQKITEESALNAYRRDLAYGRPKSLLWKDLEGMDVSQNTLNWVNKNIFGCSGELPFQKDTTN